MTSGEGGKPVAHRKQVTEGARDDGDGIDLATVPERLRPTVGFFQKNKRNFFGAALLVVLGFVANAVATDLYEKYKPWKESDDAFIDRIVNAQKEEFDSLNTRLTELRGNLPAEGRDAFREIERSLAGLERQSAGLVQQLELAKQEVVQLRGVAEARGGPGAGYDFTLASSTSMDLAPGAVIGLESTGNGSVRVNLTSEGRQVANSRLLRPGEPLTYVGAQREECFVALRSINDGRPGAASFQTACGTSPLLAAG
ncbi:hypothetical protein [Luteimonas sp. MC1825]|uniref:hypothetical protein n=1 Tax=Luteimonas sp. MC1825 TaxID=2761107 RepID=UPI00161A7C1E|nr:hypothetical protein [Luteimonas sp. MC1825]MBB6598794.1 hypothetical protein [Luteimonas sp. MC1825]QOC88950.1 hypothetical protein IDM46_04210 [Luteimonas sp. MC1825]